MAAVLHETVAVFEVDRFEDEGVWTWPPRTERHARLIVRRQHHAVDLRSIRGERLGATLFAQGGPCPCHLHPSTGSPPYGAMLGLGRTRPHSSPPHDEDSYQRYDGGRDAEADGDCVVLFCFEGD
jgi:hypothetical protein